MDVTKSQICKAAKELFNEKGYQSVSMRQIAGAAKISLGTLTYHYAHKQDLLGAIMDSTIKTFPQMPPRNIAGLKQPCKGEPAHIGIDRKTDPSAGHGYDVKPHRLVSA